MKAQSPVQNDVVREAFTQWTLELGLKDPFTRQNVGMWSRAEGRNEGRRKRRERDRQTDRERQRIYTCMCVYTGRVKQKAVNHERTGKLRNNIQLSVASSEHYHLDRRGVIGDSWEEVWSQVGKALIATLRA